MPDRVLVTRPLPPPGTSVLAAAGLTVDQHEPDRPPTRAELLERVPWCAAVLSLLTERVDAELLDAAGPSLRIVANMAVGYDNIDVAAAADRGVVVTNTPDVLTEATADLAWGLALAAARRMGEGERLVRSGRWAGWSPTELIGRPVAGATLGILGMGAIGSAVARRASGFGMEVIYTNRHPSPRAGELRARLVPFDELLATADVLSIHTPLTPETRHLLDADALARMKPTAVLVNTARGPVVDEAALVAVLASGAIAAAGLDVYEHEPAVHPGLLELDNVVVVPHLGSATTDTRAAMVRLASENIVAVLGGDAPLTPVPRPDQSGRV